MPKDGDKIAGRLITFSEGWEGALFPFSRRGELIASARSRTQSYANALFVNRVNDSQSQRGTLIVPRSTMGRRLTGETAPKIKRTERMWPEEGRERKKKKEGQGKREKGSGPDRLPN